MMGRGGEKKRQAVRKGLSKSQESLRSERRKRRQCGELVKADISVRLGREGRGIRR